MIDLHLRTLIRPNIISLGHVLSLDVANNILGLSLGLATETLGFIVLVYMIRTNKITAVVVIANEIAYWSFLQRNAAPMRTTSKKL